MGPFASLRVTRSPFPVPRSPFPVPHLYLSSMDLELVTVGTELLLGFTIDTNSAFLGQALAAAGARITRRTSVPDEAAAVGQAVGEALARSRFVITTGGLGPTRDDLTKHA